jgi:DNA-binding response OmpR family regulator
VDRRLNALAAELSDEEDPPWIYETDVLTGPREGAELTLLERYVGTALSIDQMQNPTEFVTAFPEVARVVRHLSAPADRAAELVFDLYRRHARRTCHVLSGVVRDASEAIVRRDYPSNSLLGIVCGRTSASSLVPDDAQEASKQSRRANRRLVLNDEQFEARYAGKTCILGYNYEYLLLAWLNRRPDTYVSVNALREDVWRCAMTEKNTIQRTVSNLRRRLREAGLAGVIIDGTQPGHYRLVLRGEPSAFSA